jgi:membrane protein DedA with SNARE-associated domain
MFDWVTGFVERAGYWGIALLMLAENVFPPIPSELIMPLAGFSAAKGSLSFIGVVLAGVAGSILGTVLWYAVGRWLGCERLKRFAARHGRWLTLSPDEVNQAQAWFARHGGKAVLIGRLVPGVRTLISVPAGVADMPLAPFLIYSAVGTAAWSSLLAAGGYFLESQYGTVAAFLNPVSNVVFGLIVVWYLYRVVTRPGGEGARPGGGVPPG